MAEIVIDDIAYHYRISKRAPADGPVAICVHGSGGDGVVWSYQLSRLSKEYRILIPDLPGHGRSGGDLRYTVDGYACWLNRFAAVLDLDSFVLIGHSLGGAVVQQYACLHPAKVKGLVLAATGRRFVLSRNYVAALGLEREGGEIEPEVIMQAEKLLSNLYGSDFEALAKNGLEVLHADIVAAGRFDGTGLADTITMPSLVIAGSRDVIMPPERSRELADYLPDSRFVLIEGAGHTVMLDDKKEFNAAVKDFMDTVYR